MAQPNARVQGRVRLAKLLRLRKVMMREEAVDDSDGGGKASMIRARTHPDHLSL
jgi:hypothetical protein